MGWKKGRWMPEVFCRQYRYPKYFNYLNEIVISLSEGNFVKF